jgi:DNA-binding winged helix-turn-helix (wHTH) protein
MCGDSEAGVVTIPYEHARLQVSHHGSQYNVSRELLELLDCLVDTADLVIRRADLVSGSGSGG